MIIGTDEQCILFLSNQIWFKAPLVKMDNQPKNSRTYSDLKKKKKEDLIQLSVLGVYISNSLLI